MGQKEVKTIGELHRFLQGELKEQKRSIVGEIKKNMATKGELAELKKDMTATRGDVVGLKKDMTAVKGDLGGLKKDMTSAKTQLDIVSRNMATKEDIAALSGRVSVIEDNYVRQKDFAEFKNETYTSLDEILKILRDRDTEDIAEKGGLARVSDDMEKNGRRIADNRRDINQIKLHLKVA